MNQETYQSKPTMAKWNEMVAAVGDAVQTKTGSYTGNGVNAREITVGGRPKLLIVSAEWSSVSTFALMFVTDGFEHAEGGSSHSYNPGYITLTDDGFRLNTASFNRSGGTGVWFALC